MKDLGIKSLNIISDQDATIDTNNLGTIKILLNKEEENQNLQTASTAPGSSSISSLTARTATHLSSIRPMLTAPAIEMAKNLHQLLLHFENLPTIPPTMNPINIDVKLYIQKLLVKLSTLKREEFEAEIENQNDKDFLIIYNLKNKQDQEEEEEEVPEIISETDLLKLDANNFDMIKENAVKTLVTHLMEVYERILEEHVETEIRRRRRFRGYVNFVSIYRKIEIYCNLHQERNRGETIKNQTNKKIIEYSSRKFNTRDISTIIKTGKRIESLISISNREWGIIDAFPNLEISFFKSTISTAAYEVWLKLVETGHMITEAEGEEIHNRKKDEERKERKANFRRIYESSEMGSDADSPRYYPDSEDDDDSMDLQ